MSEDVKLLSLEEIEELDEEVFSSEYPPVLPKSQVNKKDWDSLIATAKALYTPGMDTLIAEYQAEVHRLRADNERLSRVVEAAREVVEKHGVVVLTRKALQRKPGDPGRQAHSVRVEEALKDAIETLRQTFTSDALNALDAAHTERGENDGE